MIGNRQRLLRWCVYVIIDTQALADRAPELVARAAIRGGADAIQLRGKVWPARMLWECARRIGVMCRRAGVLFIVNDRSDIALAVEADGVHLGQDDLPLAATRLVRGQRRLLIGVSTHSVQQALRAQRAGADYIGVGPVFATPTKPTYAPIGIAGLQHIVARTTVPHVAIGGIDHHNVSRVVAAGARCVAVVRAVCAASDPQQATCRLRAAVLAAVAHAHVTKTKR